MAVSQNRFKRQVKSRRYNKIFFIACEGAVTEPGYFNNLKSILPSCNPNISLHCLDGHNHSAPMQVLQRIKEYVLSEKFKDDLDEAWLVVDKDDWDDEQLMLLYEWSQEKENYGFALSNPSFEYWLLLHFEDGNSITENTCLKRLKKHWPGYNKKIEAKYFSEVKIKEAIKRATLRDNPPCKSWPQKVGCTTVYRLVERILLT